MDNNHIGSTFHREKLPVILPRANQAIIVVDGTGSRAAGVVHDEVQEDAVSLARSLERQGTQVGVVGFSDSHQVLKRPQDGSSTVDAIRELFQTMEGAGASGAAAAIKAAGAMLGGPGGLILVLTDGQLLASEVRPEVQALTSAGTHVIGVAQQKDSPREMGELFDQHYRLSDKSGAPPYATTVQAPKKDPLHGAVFHPSKLAQLDAFQAERAVVIVDTSGSRVHDPSQREALRNDTVELAEAMQKHNQTMVGVLEFSGATRPHKPVDGESATAAINLAYNQGFGDSSEGGLAALREGAKMLGGPGLLVVMTDGMLPGGKNFRAEVESLEKQGYKVVGVAQERDDSRDLDASFNSFYRTSGPDNWLTR